MVVDGLTPRQFYLYLADVQYRSEEAKERKIVQMYLPIRRNGSLSKMVHCCLSAIYVVAYKACLILLVICAIKCSVLYEKAKIVKNIFTPNLQQCLHLILIINLA